MKTSREATSFWTVLLTALFVIVGIGSITTAYARNTEIAVSGIVFAFEDKDSHYEASENTTTGAVTASSNTFGRFSITGDACDAGKENGVAKYDVKEGNLVFAYSFDPARLNANEDQWHIVEDKTKQVDGITLDKNISYGAIIVQTSLDGQKWVVDTSITNAFNGGGDLKTFYSTKDIQMVNGCYYRIIVAYELQILLEKGMIFNNYGYKKCAEVYEFYVVNSRQNALCASSPQNTPRKEMGETIKTGKDNGYAGNEVIDKNDPHYGWKLGTFVINGYTRDVTDEGQPVFLKNVGDKVTLWFHLSQNIDCLNGNSALSISEDINGYDRNFETPQTNLKRGALIIRYTDYEGVKHEPIIYTDYLAANTQTGADTKVVLFEEGDYEVSLDYEIKNNPRQIGTVSVVPTYTNYKILFRFSVRNGNCMVYPFDVVTQAELSNEAITANGFRLDMAKSRYLTIDVTRSVLKEGANGLTEDVRFNRPAKDGDQYTEEGIYTFDVTNKYTNQHTVKTIYVGTNSLLQALSKNGLSIDALSEQLSLGAEISEDGTLIMPVSAIAETEPTAPSEDNLPTSPEELAPTQNEQLTPQDQSSEGAQTSSNGIVGHSEESDEKTSDGMSWIIPASIITVAGIAAFLMLRKRKKLVPQLPESLMAEENEQLHNSGEEDGSK